LIVSDRRKRVAFKDVAQAASVSTQMVSGETCQCVGVVAEKYRIPESTHFNDNFSRIPLLGGRAVQNSVEMIQDRQVILPVNEQLRFIQPILSFSESSNQV
jgi:hypothetical protein